MPVQSLTEQGRVGAEMMQRLAQFIGGDTAPQHDAAHLAPVQPLGELLHHGVGAVGGHAVHQQACGARRRCPAPRAR